MTDSSKGGKQSYRRGMDKRYRLIQSITLLFNSLPVGTWAIVHYLVNAVVLRGKKAREREREREKEREREGG